MNGKDFALLVESIQEGGKILTKEKKPARTSIFSPPDIRNIRKNAKATQIEFASMIGISFARLRNWEQGRKTPEGARFGPFESGICGSSIHQEHFEPVKSISRTT
ncbi:helix-turn-helix domain-containing protein [Sphaerochaeta halotolerans]|jgi:putative transcriptional regulator|uniref:helix-turn-helix domain-containing protein n=1 Tax=Sphaerochaeta halotolerans TaxID=2293840 RepID=UPI00136BF6E9|nr:helix-turn-helix domain-containing protein [Sphaerochaeta halotolerans]MXI87819.1 helix-turn-helix domain-containing protein [Sphaerochaeta halotolerans]